MLSDHAPFKLAGVAALIGVAAAIVFVGWPDIDLAAARLFYVGPRHFLFNHSELATALRWGFRALTWGTAIAAVTGIILALARRRHLFGLGLPECIFLALVLITGPGLIANTVLKDNWARPRPLHVTEFGGPDVMRLADLPAPEPGEGAVLIDVDAAGVNYADTHQTENSYLAAAQLPMIPGAEVVGISSDSIESHKNFAAHHELPLRLLSDSDGAVSRVYGWRGSLSG